MKIKKQKNEPNPTNSSHSKQKLNVEYKKEKKVFNQGNTNYSPLLIMFSDCFIFCSSLLTPSKSIYFFLFEFFFCPGHSVQQDIRTNCFSSQYLNKPGEIFPGYQQGNALMQVSSWNYKLCIRLFFFFLEVPVV